MIRKAVRALNHLAEACRGSRGYLFTHFEDIVPKPYQEFKDHFAKGILNKLPDSRSGTMP